MKKGNGFSLIEVLIAFSIVTMLIITVFPISIQLKKEQQKLDDRLAIITYLYEELQQHIWSSQGDITNTYTKQLNQIPLRFDYSVTSNKLVKGCVEWTNVKKQKEKTCLFGYTR